MWSFPATAGGRLGPHIRRVLRALPARPQASRGHQGGNPTPRPFAQGCVLRPAGWRRGYDRGPPSPSRLRCSLRRLVPSCPALSGTFAQFRRWTRALIALIATIYLAQGLLLLLAETGSKVGVLTFS